MRTHSGLQLASLAAAAFAALLAGCSSRAASAASSPSPDAAVAAATTQTALRPCTSVELRVDDADVVLSTNPDGTVASISATAPSPHDRARALADVRERYGAPHPDTRVITHTSKWGIPILTDSCGRSVKSAP